MNLMFFRIVVFFFMFISFHMLAAVPEATANSAKGMPTEEQSGEVIGDSFQYIFLGHGMTETMTSKLYVPKGYSKKEKYPLVVVLHGCTQSAEEIAGLTGFNRLADKEKFIVLYPEQSLAHNFKLCWNWFREAEQQGQGETLKIIKLMDKVKAGYNIDDKKVFVVGLSAGGAMASVLANCYSNHFAAAGIHSGPSYLSGTGTNAAYETMKKGSLVPLGAAAKKGFYCANKGNSQKKNRPLSVIVIHGSEDQKVTPKFLSQNLRQISFLNDWLDDGKRNKSYKLGKLKKKVDKSTGGHTYNYKSRIGTGKTNLVYVKVNAMGHKWSGGSDKYRHGDPKGPDATKFIWQLFKSAKTSKAPKE